MTPTAQLAIDRTRTTKSTSLFNHSVRSYLFADMLAAHEGLCPDVNYRREAVFYGAVLHDLGAGSAAGGRARFEVEGADLAADLLTDSGYDCAFIDSAWEAIALHSSGGIAERRGAICYLVRRGVGVDFGPSSDFIHDETAAAIHARDPRLEMEKSLAEAVIAHAGRSSQATPRFSMPATVLCEHHSGAPTTMKREASPADGVHDQ